MKLENLILTEDMVVKIMDFGHSVRRCPCRSCAPVPLCPC